MLANLTHMYTPTISTVYDTPTNYCKFSKKKKLKVGPKKKLARFAMPTTDE